MASDSDEDDGHRARLLRSALLALQPLLDTDRLSLWRISPRGVEFVRGMLEGDDARLGERAWREKQDVLREGRVARSEHGTYHPLSVDGAVVGFLQVCGGRAGLGDTQRAFMQRILADAAQALVSIDVPRAEDRDADAALRKKAPRTGVTALVRAMASAPVEAERLREFRAESRERERRWFLRALAGCEWNFAQTARRLGISRTTVWRRAKRFGIARPAPSSKDPRRGDKS